MQMTQMQSNILRFDIRRLHMNDVKMLREFDDVAAVFQRTATFAAVEVGNVRRPANTDKGNIVTAERDVCFRRRAVQHKFARCALQRLFDQRAVNPHQPGIRVHLGAGTLEVLPRFQTEYAYAQLFDHIQRGLVDRVELVGGKDGWRISGFFNLR